MPSIDDIQSKPLREQFDVVVDSIFGFGFTGAPRPPFDKVIEVRYCLQSAATIHAALSLALSSIHVLLKLGQHRSFSL